jgi:hypothetical protein
MSKHQENRILRQLNRGVIASLSLVGMLLDGAQLSDLVLQGAAMIWLWSQELQSVETACWHRLRSCRGPCPGRRLARVIPAPGGPATR